MEKKSRWIWKLQKLNPASPIHIFREPHLKISLKQDLTIYEEKYYRNLSCKYIEKSDKNFPEPGDLDNGI